MGTMLCHQVACHLIGRGLMVPGEMVIWLQIVSWRRCYSCLYVLFYLSCAIYESTLPLSMIILYVYAYAVSATMFACHFVVIKWKLYTNTQIGCLPGKCGASLNRPNYVIQNKPIVYTKQLTYSLFM